MIEVHPEVADALEADVGVVALESTVTSNLGLPSPANLEALERSLRAVRDAGAVPAVTAVLDGQLVVGVDERHHERLLGVAQKVAERELPIAVGQGWAFGATTVSASLALASSVGVSVFATGGIGGVHRGAEHTADVSADLGAIARHGVATVSAGAKSFLDLPRTLETLETLGVPVIGWRSDELPAFTARTSGIALGHRCDDIDELASIVRVQRGLGRGLLITNPVPEADALDQDAHDAALDDALTEAARRKITGAAVTPMVLGRIAEATAGASVPANIALLEHNATVAGQLAVAMTGS